MKAISPELEALLGADATALCRLWTITRKDGVVFYFTDHDRDIPYDGNVYLANNSFEATAVQSSVNSAAADLDINIMLADGSLEYLDMQRGMFDEAPITLQVISWNDTSAGTLDLFAGTVSTIDLPSRQFGKLRLRGGVSKVMAVMTEQYSATCRRVFGDALCKFPLATVTTNFTVTGVTSPQQFASTDLVAKATNLYTVGTIEWVTGDNAGSRVEVAGNNAGAVQMLFRPPYQVQVGDTGKIIQGCSKTVAACTSYSNIPNYRGEPYVPGDAGLGT